MLVLSRKPGSKIVVNDDIWITILEIRGDKVRVGIEAPKEVPVHREEVYNLIKAKAATAEALAELAAEDAPAPDVPEHVSSDG